MASDPATRADFADLLPPIMIESPVYWASSGDNPLVVNGTANVFEATVSLELLDQDGTVLWEGFTTATCGTGCRGDFSVEIPYEVAEGPDRHPGGLGDLHGGRQPPLRAAPPGVAERHPRGRPRPPTRSPPCWPSATTSTRRSTPTWKNWPPSTPNWRACPSTRGPSCAPAAPRLDQQVSEVRDGLEPGLRRTAAPGCRLRDPLLRRRAGLGLRSTSPSCPTGGRPAPRRLRRRPGLQLGGAARPARRRPPSPTPSARTATRSASGSAWSSSTTSRCSTSPACCSAPSA